MLTPEYLKQKLNSIFPQPTEKITLHKLKGDASVRQFFRLTSYQQNQHQQTLVVMKFPQPTPAEEEAYISTRQYFHNTGVTVPKLYHYDAEHGVFFLEDLGDTTLAIAMRQADTATARRYYRQAIDTLLKFQLASLIHPDPHCLAFQRAFDQEKFSQELEFFIKYMLEGYRQQRLIPGDRLLLQEMFHQLASFLAAEPKCLSHRDYHSRNLMLYQGKIGQVDFQDARLGLCQYDLASLLRDSYISLPDTLVSELIDYYIQQKELRLGAPVARRHFYLLFDYVSLQRNLKAIGTFAYLYLEHGFASYLEYIPLTLVYVRKTLSKYEQFSPLQHLLGKYLPEVA